MVFSISKLLNDVLHTSGSRHSNPSFNQFQNNYPKICIIGINMVIVLHFNVAPNASDSVIKPSHVQPIVSLDSMVEQPPPKKKSWVQFQCSHPLGVGIPTRNYILQAMIITILLIMLQVRACQSHKAQNFELKVKIKPFKQLVFFPTLIYL